MRHTISVAICVIVSLVLAAIGTRYVHPHWLFAIVHSLQLHLAVCCVAGAIIAIIFKRSLIGYLILIVSIAVLGHTLYMTREFSAMTTEADAGAPTFRLLSFNILADNYDNSAAIADAIIASGAELVNVMEAQPLLGQMDHLMTAYPYRVGCGVMIDSCDQLMLSKAPIEKPIVRTLSEIFDNRFIMSEVTVAGHRINFAGIHTTKPYFDNFHTMELVRAALAITDTTGPLLISGDFNASSLAPNMRRFLRWAELGTANWEPATWPIEAGEFGVPIDHVYVRAPLKIKSLTRLPDALGSNHDGLLAEIAITGK